MKTLARWGWLTLAVFLAGGTAVADTTPADSRCLACHREAQAAMPTGSAHGATTGIGCESCHRQNGNHPADGAGAILAFGTRSTSPAADQDRACLGCHVEAASDWTGSRHESNDVPCAACHLAHAPREPLGNAAAQSAICFDCHRRQRAEVQKPYRHPLREGRIACSDCHAPHGSATAFELRRPTLNETCFDCHAEKRGPFLFEHAPAAEDCSLCHASHGSNHPGMLARRAPLLCQQCHSQAGHSSIAGSPGGLAGSGSPSPLLLAGSCMNCHTQVHGSNHPSGITLMR
ncbi:MAG: DmsE family decaheme c-type cytochrome [Gammaproteobacteria bacterium]|nr:DmsE family decaheme c-type cytochrome [Gammaproteobacteria bacterium]